MVTHIGAATVESSTNIPQKIKNGTTIIPSHSTSGYLSEEIQNTHSKNICTTMLTAALLTIAKTGKQPKCPVTEELIKEMWHLYQRAIGHEKNEITASATTQVDLEGVMLCEICQTEKQIPYDFTYMCNLKNKINKQTNTQIQRTFW